MPTTRPHLIKGARTTDQLDLLLINAPLRDYSQRPRVNDYTLPVLGMAYIATYAAASGYNVAVLDAEAHGLPVADTIALINQAAPRWAGFNLLAPTYEISADIAAALVPDIRVMVGGHHAKALPATVLTDPRFARCDALVLGEAETRVVELLADHRSRASLPGVMWMDPVLAAPVAGGRPGNGHHLAPDIDALPFINRDFLAQDPYQAGDGRMERTWSAPAAAPTTAPSAAPLSPPTLTSRSGSATRATSSPRCTNSMTGTR